MGDGRLVKSADLNASSFVLCTSNRARATLQFTKLLILFYIPEHGLIVVFGPTPRSTSTLARWSSLANFWAALSCPHSRLLALLNSFRRILAVPPTPAALSAAGPTQHRLAEAAAAAQRLSMEEEDRDAQLPDSAVAPTPPRRTIVPIDARWSRAPSPALAGTGTDLAHHR